MEILFWTFFGLVVWCYAGYPAVMEVRARLARRARGGSGQPGSRAGGPRPSMSVDGDGPSADPPFVSVVLAVRNEADRIGPRLRNLLALDYPEDRLEVVVVCNGCEDGTEEAAWKVAHQDARIRLLGSPAPEGKAGALNRGVAAARGSALVFADARQSFAPDAVTRLVSRLYEPDVGAVSGRLVVGETGATVLEGVRRYWSYETRLRLAESDTGSVIGVTGAIYAIRKELYRPLPPGLILDDVYLPLEIVQQDRRVVLEPGAVASDEAAESPDSEFARKLRTAVGNLQILRLKPDLLVPWRNPVFGRYFSHKLLRVASPVFLLGILALGFLLGGMVYGGIATVQLAFYSVGALGLLVPAPVLALPSAFLLVHAALVCALVRRDRGAESVWRGADAA